MFACVMVRAARAAPQSYATAKTLLDALTPYNQDDVQGQWSDDRMLMVQALTWNTPQSRHESTPEVCRESGRVIVAWVRLDNRAELCVKLGLVDTSTLTDPQIILASHAKWGSECADRLEGDFSFVIYDPPTGQTFCARDSIGAKPFFYYLDETVFVAASTATVFPLLKTLPIIPSRSWMAQYMANAPHDMTSSAFENVMRLAPAHCLQVRRQGACESQEFFRFQDVAPITDHRDPKYVEAYRDAFHQATRTRLRSDFLVGAESSGGLDSSSIVAHAVKHLPHGIDGFHCFGLCNYDDEPEQLLQTALHCGVRHSHITTHTQMYENQHALTRDLRVIGYPAEHNQAQWHATILRQCEQLDIRTLLSGYGGDEMVTHQAAALHTELFNNQQFGSLAREMHGNAVTRRMRYFIKRRRMSHAASGTGSQSNPAFLNGLLRNSMLRQDVVDEFDIQARSTAGYTRQQQARTLNEHMLSGPEFAPRRVARLEACALIAHSHRVEYRWPLYDRQLMMQFLRTPALEKRSRTMGRYLHRRAVAGSIPDMITWKQSKDLGNFTTGLTDREMPESLTPEDAPPMLRTILDFSKIQTAQSEFSSAKADNDFGSQSIQQLNGLWRASLLSRWLAQTPN